MPDSNIYSPSMSDDKYKQLLSTLPSAPTLTQDEADALVQTRANKAPVAPPNTPVGSEIPAGTSASPTDYAPVASDLTSTNAPLVKPTVGVIPSNLEGREYVRETQRQEAVRPKTAGEANLLSKATKDMFIPDYEGNYHLNGKLMTPEDVQGKYPDVWAKMKAPKSIATPAIAKSPEEAMGMIDKVLHRVPGAEALGDYAHELALSGESVIDYASHHPGAIPGDIFAAIPKGVYKFGQMVWGGAGGITQAMGDWMQYAAPASGWKSGSEVAGRKISDFGKGLRKFVDSKQVSHAMGLGEEGGEDPFGQFLSGLASLAPAIGLGKAVSMGTLYGATGAGETYGRAEDVQEASGQPVSHLRSAAAALIAGATNAYVGKMLPEGLNPESLNPLFREALPTNVAVAALNAAQLTVGHNLAKSIYDPAAVPKDWMDALNKSFDGYFQTLPTLLGVHALSAYTAYKVANAKDFIGRPEEEGTGEKPYATALLRAQDPSTAQFVMNLIAQADSPEAAEMARQRVRAMFERRDSEALGGFFRGHFDTFFPPITAENFAKWGPTIPGVTSAGRAPDAPQAAEAAKGDAPVAAVEPQGKTAVEPSPARVEPVVEPSPTSTGQSALDAARTSQTRTQVQPIGVHGSLPPISDAFKGAKPEDIPAGEHTPDTALVAANRGIAYSMETLIRGAHTASGNEVDVPGMRGIINGLQAPNGPAKVADRLRQLDGGTGAIPSVIMDSLDAIAPKFSAAPLNSTFSGPIATPELAHRNFALLQAFHDELAERVRAMGTQVDSQYPWLRSAVSAIGKVVAAGSKYDVAVHEGARKGMGIPQRPVVPESVSTQPIAQEVSGGQAAERSTGGEAVQAQEATGGIERGAVQAGTGEGEAVQPRPAETGGEPGTVLETNPGATASAEPGVGGPGNEAARDASAGAVRQPEAPAAPVTGPGSADLAHLSPAMQAAVMRGRESMRQLIESGGVPDGNVGVIDAHTEIMETTNWPIGKEGESEESAGPTHKFVGPSEMLYPVPPGCPYTHPFNLTASVAISPETIEALGLPPLGAVPAIGTVVHAAINANPEKLETVYGILRGLGFDSIASTVSAHGEGVSFSSIEKGGVTKSGVPFLGRPWGKRPDGRIGYLSLPDDEVIHTPEAKPSDVAKLPEPTRPIEDPAKLQEALQAADALWRNHHIESMHLLDMMRSSGVPIGDSEMQNAASKGINDGFSTSEVKDILQVISQDQGTGDTNRWERPDTGLGKGKTYTVGNFMEFIKAGGLAHVAEELAHSPRFVMDMKTGKRYGRREFTRAANGDLDATGKEPMLGSNAVYNRARAAVNAIVKHAVDDGRADVAGLSKMATSGTLGQDQNRIVALMALAIAEYSPSFFSADPKFIEDMRMRESSDKTLAKLADYFEPREAGPESFSPVTDVFNNPEVTTEAKKEAGHTPPSRVVPARRVGPARRQELLNKAATLIGSRGLFTPDVLAQQGIPMHPKVDHAALHESTVTRILMNPETIGKITDSVGLDGYNFLTGSAPHHLIANGYAGLLLNRLAGFGKRPFHMDAYNTDPTFEKHYTVGEETVLQLNEFTADGLPVDESIMTHDDMAILLDHNDPRYSQTVERVVSQISSDPQLNGGPTKLRRVVEIKPDGQVIGRLVPVERIHANYSHVQTLLAGAGLLAPNSSRWVGLRINNPDLVRRRLQQAVGGMLSGDSEWHRHLGSDLCEQLATAKTALDAVAKADVGQEEPYGELRGTAMKIADIAFSGVGGAPSRLLRKFVKNTEARLKAVEESKTVLAIENAKKIEAIVNRLSDHAEASNSDVAVFAKTAQREIDALPDEEDIEAQDAASEADHIMDGLNKSKNDTPWGEVFPNTSRAMITAKQPESCITNKVQMMALIREMGITPEDPKTKYMFDVFNKMNPAFFRELGIQIDMNPECDTGWFDFTRRLIGVSGQFKQWSATTCARLMAHELGHAFTAYMSLPMQRVMDRWFQNAYAKVADANPRFADVMNADAINQLTGETNSVKIMFSGHGTKSPVVIAPDSGNSLLAKYPDLASSMKKIFTHDGEHMGYILSRDFAGRNMYRFMALHEFIAESFLDGVREHATARVGSRRVTNEYAKTMGPAALEAFNTAHRNMGKMIDAVVGKTTMRRFIGNVLAQKVNPSQLANIESPAFIEKLVPNAPSNGPPVFKDGSPETAAKRDYSLATGIGTLLNIPRSILMRVFNAATVSDNARNMQLITRPENGAATQFVVTAGGMLHGFYGAAEEQAKVTGEDRRALIAALANTETGRAASFSAKSLGLAHTTLLDGPTQKFWVKVGPDGKYQRAMPEAAVNAWEEYYRTGKFTGPLAGMEKPTKQLADFIWHRLKGDIAELCDAMGVPVEAMNSVEDALMHRGTPPKGTEGAQATRKINNYLPQQWDGRQPVGTIQRLFGIAPKAPHLGMAKEATDAASREAAGTAAREYGFDAPQDVNLSMWMLHQRQFDGPVDGLEHNRFPVNTNVVDQIISGLSAGSLTSAKLRVLSSALRSGEARVGRPADKSDPAYSWPEVNLKTIGMPEGLLPDAFDNIRMHPDSFRVMHHTMAPNPLAKGQVYRDAILGNTIANGIALWGMFDWTNGTLMNMHFYAELPQEVRKDLEATRNSLKVATNVGNVLAGAAGLAGVAYGAMHGGIGNAGALGAAGVLSMSAMAAAYKARRAMFGGFGDMAAKGREVQNILESEAMLHPERMPKQTQELMAFMQMVNAKTMSSKTQIERSQHLYKALWREGSHVRAGFMGLARLVGKMSLYGDNGLLKIPGKQQLKMGFLATAAPGILGKYRDAAGNVDFTNKELMEEGFQASDDADALVGSAQGRNLNQSPAMRAVAQSLFIAWDFTFPTIKAGTMMAADVANNFCNTPMAHRVGLHEQWEAFRKSATNGGTRRPIPEEGSNYAWRRSTLALRQSFLVGIIAARLMSIGSHIVFPHSHYSMSHAASVAVAEVRAQKGALLGGLYGGLATVAPPEGSSLWDGIRHATLELMAPQIGRDIPVIQGPQRTVAPGAHYLPDIINPAIRLSPHPSVTLNPRAQLDRILEFMQSKQSWLSSAVTTTVNGRDALGRPLGATGSFANMNSVKRFNEWAQAHADDGPVRESLRAIARGVAFTVTNRFPLSIRGLGHAARSGDFTRPVSSFGGMRTLPARDALATEAERMAYDAMMSKVAGHPSSRTESESEKLAEAKADLIENNDRTKLNKLVDEGVLEKSAAKRIVASYYDPHTHQLRDRLIVMLRSAQDRDKEVWKQVYAVATDRQRDTMKEYIHAHEGSGYTSAAKAKNNMLYMWMKDYDKRNPILRAIW
jgi:hypothetical protein